MAFNWNIKKIFKKFSFLSLTVPFNISFKSLFNNMKPKRRIDALCLLKSPTIFPNMKYYSTDMSIINNDNIQGNIKYKKNNYMEYCIWSRDEDIGYNTEGFLRYGAYIFMIRVTTENVDLTINPNLFGKFKTTILKNFNMAITIKDVISKEILYSTNYNLNLTNTELNIRNVSLKGILKGREYTYLKIYSNSPYPLPSNEWYQWSKFYLSGGYNGSITLQIKLNDMFFIKGHESMSLYAYGSNNRKEISTSKDISNITDISIMVLGKIKNTDYNTPHYEFPIRSGLSSREGTVNIEIYNITKNKVEKKFVYDANLEGYSNNDYEVGYGTLIQYSIDNLNTEDTYKVKVKMIPNVSYISKVALPLIDVYWGNKDFNFNDEINLFAFESDEEVQN